MFGRNTETAQSGQISLCDRRQRVRLKRTFSLDIFEKKKIYLSKQGDLRKDQNKNLKILMKITRLRRMGKWNNFTLDKKKGGTCLEFSKNGSWVSIPYKKLD